MDPNACLRLFLFATTLAERKAAARDYRGWVSRGGFRATLIVNGERHAVLRLLGRWGSDAVVTSPVVECVSPKGGA
jgi:hypothetical protein